MAGIVMVPNDETYNMQCFPLYSLLMAAGNRTVNYLSLDIEGAEFMVRWGSDPTPICHINDSSELVKLLYED